MADALEQLQHVLSGIGLTQLPRILQGLQKARGAGGGAGEREGTAAQGGPPTLPERAAAQPAPADDNGNPLAGISPEQAAQFVPQLMAMARQQRGGGIPGMGAGRQLPPGPQGTIPRMSTMDAGR